MLGLELGRQDVPGLKNTGVNFLASGCRRPVFRHIKNGNTEKNRKSLISHYVFGPFSKIFFHIEASIVVNFKQK